MNRPPLFRETLALRGVVEEPRRLGAVNAGLTLIPDPEFINRLTRMLKNQLCRICDDVPESNRTCVPCAAELVAAAERDAGARTSLASLRALVDPMTGRYDTGAGGW